jgi:hypothetical protein
MKTVRLTAGILYFLTRTASILYFITAAYALVVILLSMNFSSAAVPIRIWDGRFEIFYPFTQTPFLLGEYNGSFLSISISVMILYGIFLWLLSGVFHAFKQQKLFTKKGVLQLSRFYIVNLTVPVLFLAILAGLGQDIRDGIMIGFLHLIIGVFAFFMATIFRQGLVLQEEQDLTL